MIGEPKGLAMTPVMWDGGPNSTPETIGPNPGSWPTVPDRGPITKKAADRGHRDHQGGAARGLLSGPSVARELSLSAQPSAYSAGEHA